MADPIVLPLEEDPTVIEQEMYSYIQSFYPEWDPKEPQLAVIMSEAFAAEISDLRRLATDVGPEILIYIGRLLGITQEEAVEASGVVNITAIDNLGYTIPAGTEMRILVHSDEYVGFATTVDAVIAPGQTQALAVPIIATTTGSAGNGLSTAPELLDILDYISSIALVGSTGGGTDPENIDDYLSRLRLRFQLLADRPIIPRDFEIYVETLVPGVSRALCLDTYDPVAETYGNERMVTIVAVDEDGVGVGPSIQTDIEEILEAARELTFVVHTMDPTYNAITVAATVVPLPGWDVAALDTTVTAAVVDFLSPANFGQPTIGTGDSRQWLLTDRIRYSDLHWLIRNVEGVQNIDGPVTINGVDDTDFVLTGEAPLPAVNPTVNITVTP